MRTIYAIVCMRTLRDADTNRVSAIDFVETFSASSFPVVFPRLGLLWTLHRDAGEAEEVHGTVTLRLNDQQIQQFVADFNFAGAMNTRCILAVGGLALTGPGHVCFRFEAPGLAPSDWEFDVTAVPGVQGVPGAAMIAI